MKRQILLGLLLLAALGVPVIAQTDAELESVDEKLIRHLETKMPGWQHRRVNPIEGSKKVIINHWQTSTRVVTISIVRYDSAVKAQETMQPFIKYMRQKEELKGFGADAYAWGYGLSNIMFRRGRFVISLSAYADVGSDPDGRAISPEQKSERERSEMKRLTEQFAKHVFAAMDTP